MYGLYIDWEIQRTHQITDLDTSDTIYIFITIIREIRTLLIVVQGRFKMHGAPDIKSCTRLNGLNELEPIKFDVIL